MMKKLGIAELNSKFSNIQIVVNNQKFRLSDGSNFTLRHPVEIDYIVAIAAYLLSYITQ